MATIIYLFFLYLSFLLNLFLLFSKFRHPVHLIHLLHFKFFLYAFPSQIIDLLINSFEFLILTLLLQHHLLNFIIASIVFNHFAIITKIIIIAREFLPRMGLSSLYYLHHPVLHPPPPLLQPIIVNKPRALITVPQSTLLLHLHLNIHLLLPHHIRTPLDLCFPLAFAI